MNGSELLLNNAERYGLMLAQAVEAPRKLSRPNIGMTSRVQVIRSQQHLYLCPTNVGISYLDPSLSKLLYLSLYLLYCTQGIIAAYVIIHDCSGLGGTSSNFTYTLRI